RSSEPENIALVESKKLNFSFRDPRGAWKDDPNAERELGATLAKRRSDPNAWFALVVRDYTDRMPRDDEMVREAVLRLQKLFKKKPAWELKDDTTFADLPAQRLVFMADYSSISVSGECIMTADKGIGYWFFGWTPSAIDEDSVVRVMDEWQT